MPNEGKHSVLAPSSKEWVHCGYLAKFLATKEEETNDASEFGTKYCFITNHWDTKSYIEDNYGDFNNWLTIQIEATIDLLKNS